MFPVWINDGSSEMPDDSIFYIIAKDGIYLKKTMNHFDTMTKVDSISILNAVESKATLNVAKIKTKQFAQILKFFKDVYEKYHAEVNVILHYNLKRKTYRIDVPKQDVSGASVEYVNGEDSYKNYLRIGTIHSHSSMSAFHSGTDYGDESNWDGLHITLGHMNKENFDISCSIMASGERFMVSPLDYIDGLEIIEYEEETTYQNYNWMTGAQTVNKPKTKLGYSINVEEKDVCYPSKWMKKVDKLKPKIIHTTKEIDFSNLSRFYRHSINQPRKNEDLFTGVYDVNETEWNACAQCPYKHHKSDMMMQELLDNLDDETAEKLGLVVDDEDDIFKNVKSPFYLNDNPLDNGGIE